MVDLRKLRLAALEVGESGSMKVLGAECQRCALREVPKALRPFEAYTFEPKREMVPIFGARMLRYNIDIARAALEGTKREAFEVDPAIVVSCATAIEEVHIDHVNIAEPGIGIQMHGFGVVIDGMHRAARCLRIGLPFRVLVLTDEEERAARMFAVI